MKGGDLLDKKRKKRTIFQCEILSPDVYDEVDPELTNPFIKNPVGQKLWLPGLGSGKSSFKALRRKLNRYRKGGFGSLARKKIGAEDRACDLFGLTGLNKRFYLSRGQTVWRSNFGGLRQPREDGLVGLSPPPKTDIIIRPMR